MYSEDSRNGDYSDTFSDGDNDLGWLYPDYIKNLKVFVCPSTKHIVREGLYDKKRIGRGRVGLKDLMDLPSGKLGYGTSYEIFGFMGARYDLTPEERPAITKKSASSVMVYVHKAKAFDLAGVIPGPSRIWLLVDQDSGSGGSNNYPDAADNHGDAGSNVVFCDSHVEWVSKSKYLLSYEMSQDENRSRP